MSKRQSLNIVWLKRDLRTQDHASLLAAENDGLPYLVIYLFEPHLMDYPDTSLRHLQFIYHSIIDLQHSLKNENAIRIFHGEAVDILSFLFSNFDIQKMWSYQESGTLITWKRDKAVKRLCQSSSVKWTALQRDGIIRGIKNRDGWDERWFQVMNQPIIKNSFSNIYLEALHHPFPMDIQLIDQLKNYPNQYQPAGESFAWKYLHSFVKDRGHNYHRHISKPTESRTSCGRLSPYLAWGCLSIRQAYQFLSNSTQMGKHKAARRGIITRLIWHCHFIQKFEVECTYEFAHLNRAYDSMSYENNDHKLDAWKRGQTGIPLIDACMRALHYTGWINFRMRAMLVSFLCHHLDQDWRRGAHFLAQQFLDYEPGIHFPQFQMQAGTTGINTLRIYNPTKQAIEHDPEGIFIRKWIPELRDLPIGYLHEPWKMTTMDRALYPSIEDYPRAIIDVEKAGQLARKKLWSFRKSPAVKANKPSILQKHTHQQSTPSKNEKARPPL